MINKSWSELNYVCPVDIERIITYAKEFESNLPNKITAKNLDSSKEGVLNARANFDSMVTTLTQVLHNKDILKKKEDKILYAWMVDNFGRYMKRLDDEEFNLIIKFDEPKGEGRVGVSRISAYSKLLLTSSDSIIYESLLMATNEYNSIKETDELKKEPRAFLYILFQIIQVTLSVLGGITREKAGTPLKKGTIQTFPLSYQSLMGEEGQKVIKKGFKEETGIDLEKFDEDLDSLESPDSSEHIEEVIGEEDEEDEEGGEDD